MTGDGVGSIVFSLETLLRCDCVASETALESSSPFSLKEDVAFFSDEDAVAPFLTEGVDNDRSVTGGSEGGGPQPSSPGDEDARRVFGLPRRAGPEI